MRRIFRIVLLLLILEHGSEIYDGIQGSIGIIRDIGRRLEAAAEGAEGFFRGLGFESGSESEIEIVLGNETMI